MSDFLRPHETQHARPPCPSPTPGIHPNPCPLSRWCDPTINFVPLKTQSSVPIFTWEWDYWLDHSLLLWTLLFLHQVASVSSFPLLFSIQLRESLCVPDGGEHLGNWILAGPVSLLFISLFYPPSHLCLLPPSPLPCITREHIWAVRLWRDHKEVITG